MENHRDRVYSKAMKVSVLADDKRWKAADVDVQEEVKGELQWAFLDLLQTCREGDELCTTATETE